MCPSKSVQSLQAGITEDYAKQYDKGYSCCKQCGCTCSGCLSTCCVFDCVWDKCCTCKAHCHLSIVCHIIIFYALTRFNPQDTCFCCTCCTKRNNTDRWDYFCCKAQNSSVFCVKKNDEDSLYETLEPCCDCLKEVPIYSKKYWSGLCCARASLCMCCQKETSENNKCAWKMCCWVCHCVCTSASNVDSDVESDKSSDVIENAKNTQYKAIPSNELKL